ncbi:MAG TPA: cellulase N-terminal Ig-like domain-containing protein, partial [Longimicrobiales bacterium]
MFRHSQVLLLTALLLPASIRAQTPAFRLAPAGYLSARGADVLVFSNWYSGLFSDSKLSGIELIHHGVRTATNGDVRLSRTPEQWDPIPEFVGRDVDSASGRIRARLRYPKYDFAYAIVAEPDPYGVQVSVELERPLPAELAGRAGFNLEFLPSAYFGKTWSADGRAGAFPRQAGGAMRPSAWGRLEAVPLDSARTFVLAPEDPERRVMVETHGWIALYDGRTKAQNGWFVLRGLLPAGKTGRVLEWHIWPNRIPGWTRPPVIAHSQAGYAPSQAKVAVLELDPNYAAPPSATLLRLSPYGELTPVLRATATPWGRWLRYEYRRFDFSGVRQPGTYLIEYGGVRTEPFRIGDDVYAGIWQSTLDTFMPVQMDHVLVREGYRVWHGAAHLDDARQAPAPHEHFDLYAQGPGTDSPFKAGDHIPGLNVGGWFDAGDFDIRTQSQYAVIQDLALAYTEFDLKYDQLTVDEKARSVEMHRPDGIPDAVQQVKHGVLQV